MRRKVIAVSNHTILQAFTGMSKLQDYIVLHKIKDLPDDVECKYCCYEPTRNCWLLVLEHESFPEVKDLEVMPEILTKESETVEIRRNNLPVSRPPEVRDLFRVYRMLTEEQQLEVREELQRKY